MEDLLRQVDIAWPGHEVVSAYVRLRVACEAVGRPLGQWVHEADRWIATAALRLGCPLVAHDRVFVETALDP